MWPAARRRGRHNHVERFNNTLRQRLARFVRDTLSFSKKRLMHKVCLYLFICDHNRQQSLHHNNPN